MTKFETYLIELGYVKFRFDCKKMSYEKTDLHTLSSLTNLDHRYFPSYAANEPEKHKDLQIVFGLHEVGKPSTLIWPRPNFVIQKKVNGKTIFDSEKNDDNINRILDTVDFDKIYKAMFDSSITLIV